VERIMNCCLPSSKMIMKRLHMNEQISVVGYITEAEEGAIIKTKGGNTHKITAQGWNAFRK